MPQDNVWNLANTSILILILIFIIIVLLIVVCVFCFKSKKRSDKKKAKKKVESSRNSNDFILDKSNEINNSTPPTTPRSPACSVNQTTLYSCPRDWEYIRKYRPSIISNDNRNSEPTPNLLSPFLKQQDEHVLHASVVVCSKGSDTKVPCITVFDKQLDNNDVTNLSNVFAKNEFCIKKDSLLLSPIINMPSQSENELLRSLQTQGFNRKLSLTQRTSENSGLRFPIEQCLSPFSCRSQLMDESIASGKTIYSNEAIFDFADKVESIMKKDDRCERDCKHHVKFNQK